jgi:crotonobetainyl-CoA:carnitine CoA-transferase CaiB-like acyl-CoA transferase
MDREAVPVANNPLPLSRFKVVDLTAHRAGPTAVRQLADWGAETIKVEAPPAINKDKGGLIGSRHGFDLQNLHRNKRSMTLDLKSAEGKEIFFRLVKEADVVVENYRSRVKHRLGVDYEACRKANPRIVYGSIAGFGQDGPYGARPGVDQIAQGMGGLMSVTGLPGQGPVRVGIPICDLTAGVFLAQGILIALLEREISGEGQWVHTSLLQAMISMMDFQAARYLKDGEVPKQAGNNHPTGVPTGVFPTADGHINIAASGAVLFERLCKALDAEQILENPAYKTFETRSANRDELNSEISEVTRTKPSQHWVELLNDAGVPCGPIYDVEQVFNDPQVRHLGIAVPVESPALGEFPVVGQPVVLTRTPQPKKMRRATPEFGEHTDDILKDLGFGKKEIAGLRARGAV